MVSSELRQDLVTGDWVVVAPGRGRRPHFAKAKRRKRLVQPKEKCPFEDPQATGHGEPLLVLPNRDTWFAQVVPNKFPAFGHGECSVQHKDGPYVWLEGAGFHEVFIYRNHERPLADFSDEEMAWVMGAFRERYEALRDETCVEYVSMFHNWGAEAGASISHPHSQLIAMPVIPPDVARSLKGSKAYFDEKGACVHCAMIAFEQGHGERVIEKTEHFIALAPYASRIAFEARVFPLEHIASFRNTPVEHLKEAGALLRNVLKKIAAGLNDPPLNFFLHTAPTHGEQFKYYHWHFEIFPKTSIWAGFEMSTGIETAEVAPETAAAYLREQATT